MSTENKYVVWGNIGGFMFRIVICEDDLSQRELLKGFIYKVFEEIQEDLDLIEFGSGEEVLSEEVILEGIDIFFLDIQMNELTGMDLARLIRKENDTSEIIFVTSLVDYIQEGYTVRAYRYLLKPINYDDLKSHLLNCISDIKNKRDNFMIIENKGFIYKVLISKIMYIEVRKKDLTIYTLDGAYYTKNSMDKVEKELVRYNFYRCHKSYLVNMEHIEIINKNTIFIGNEKIPVSKHRISDLKTKLTYILGDVLC